MYEARHAASARGDGVTNISTMCSACPGTGRSGRYPASVNSRESGYHDRDDSSPFRQILLGELLEGKAHEQFLWGGAGNGLGSRHGTAPVRYPTASSRRCNGNDGSSFAGSTTRRIFSGLCNSQPFAYRSSNFEICFNHINTNCNSIKRSTATFDRSFRVWNREAYCGPTEETRITT
jgi:hypothetical protein